MKFTLSFTTTYLLFGISYCIAINENSDSTIGISKQENIRRIPTHIIKFKAPSIKNITGRHYLPAIRLIFLLINY